LKIFREPVEADFMAEDEHWVSVYESQPEEDETLHLVIKIKIKLKQLCLNNTKTQLRFALFSYIDDETSILYGAYECSIDELLNA